MGEEEAMRGEEMGIEEVKGRRGEGVVGSWSELMGRERVHEERKAKRRAKWGRRGVHGEGRD